MFNLLDKRQKKSLILTGITALVLIFFYKVRNILSPFIVAFFISLLMEKLRNKISNKFKISKRISSAILVFLVFLLIFTTFIFLIPLYFKKLISIFNTISYDDVSHITKIINTRIDKIFSGEISQTIKNELLGYFSSHLDLKDSIAKMMKHSISNLTSSFSMVIIPIASYIILVEIKRIRTTFYILFFNKKTRYKIASFLNSSFNRIKDYLKIQLSTSLILSILYSAPLIIMGIKSGILIGILVSCLSFIPYIGFYIGLSISCLITFENYNNLHMVIKVVTSLMSCQAIDSLILSPRILGNRLNISPFWMMFGTLSAVELFGTVGVFIGIPIVILIDSSIRIFVDLDRDFNN